MKQTILTVSAPAEGVYTEKKSRFVGEISPAADEAEALAFLEAARARHRDARHHCYAWCIGAEAQLQRSSDAGEPAGTAGRPILETLHHAGLTNVVLVVSRYFGGILLGAGGLTRAYAKAAQQAVDAASQVRCLPAIRFALSFPYTQLRQMEYTCGQYAVFVEQRQYAEQVCFFCLAEAPGYAALKTQSQEAGGGAVHLQVLEEDAMLQVPLSTT